MIMLKDMPVTKPATSHVERESVTQGGHSSNSDMQSCLASVQG